ncbi:glycoside hydrolase family 3 N-terminal domain-containing protein [Leptospira weilii]|uniref:glycoside hydrolase family 3 N-terminal domain-containing protein n=1 Tax=Leptospira weilii TaxID=28184 RepID=UPI001E31A3F7|nr:glycoside hydrolase family 3 N-terminal domain-containing protein [Leptospira weilii]
MIPLLSIFVYSYLETDFQGSKRFVSGADRIILAKYAEHVLVGYRNDEQLSELLRIPFAGFFITAHNVTDLDANGLRAKIERIQIVRKNIGFPPAIIASDQEGGPVSRLSPPLPRPKGLGELYKGSSTFISDKAEIRKELRIASGTLSDIGLNLNFAPVTDLKKEHSNSLDFFSKISSRAVSENPEIASEAVGIASEILLQNGILPTLKHFPGIASVREDTHFFSGFITKSVSESEQTDLIPFRKNVEKFPLLAFMLSHSIWKGVDPENPVSVSEAVIRRYVREKISSEVILITDDLNMFPVFYRKGGISKAASDSLRAGTDLLLISYDGEQAYRVLYDLIREEEQERSVDLNPSKERLTRVRKFLFK